MLIRSVLLRNIKSYGEGPDGAGLGRLVSLSDFAPHHIQNAAGGAAGELREHRQHDDPVHSLAPELAQRLSAFREEQAAKVTRKDEQLQDELGG